MNRDKIIKEASRLFAYRGIRATSLKDIALESRITQAEMAHHFSTKKALVSAIIDDFIERNERHLRFNPQLSPDVSYEIKNFFRLIEHSLETLRPLFLWEIRKYYKPQWEKIVTFRDQQMITYLNDNIKRGIAQGYYFIPGQAEMYGSVYFVILSEIVTHPLYNSTISMVKIMNKVFYNSILRGSEKSALN